MPDISPSTTDRFVRRWLDRITRSAATVPPEDLPDWISEQFHTWLNDVSAVSPTASDTADHYAALVVELTHRLPKRERREVPADLTASINAAATACNRTLDETMGAGKPGPIRWSGDTAAALFRGACERTAMSRPTWTLRHEHQDRGAHVAYRQVLEDMAHACYQLLAEALPAIYNATTPTQRSECHAELQSIGAGCSATVVRAICEEIAATTDQTYVLTEAADWHSQSEPGSLPWLLHLVVVVFRQVVIASDRLAPESNPRSAMLLLEVDRARRHVMEVLDACCCQGM